MVSPRRIAEYHNSLRGQRVVFFREKSAAHTHVGPEDSKVIRRNQNGLRSFSERLKSEENSALRQGCEARKSFRMSGQIAEFRDAKSGQAVSTVGRTGAPGEDSDHALRLFHGPVPQHNG